MKAVEIDCQDSWLWIEMREEVISFEMKFFKGGAIIFFIYTHFFVPSIIQQQIRATEAMPKRLFVVIKKLFVFGMCDGLTFLWLFDPWSSTSYIVTLTTHVNWINFFAFFKRKRNVSFNVLDVFGGNSIGRFLCLRKKWWRGEEMCNVF